MEYGTGDLKYPYERIFKFTSKEIESGGRHELEFIYNWYDRLKIGDYLQGYASDFSMKNLARVVSWKDRTNEEIYEIIDKVRRFKQATVSIHPVDNYNITYL